MTKIYRGLGVSCMYPESWRLSEDTDDGVTVGFMLESTTSAFMTVHAYPWSVPPSDAISQAADAMKSEYDEFEFEEIDPPVRLTEGPLQDARAADLNFFVLDMLVVSRLIAFSIQHRTFLVQCQAEDRDFRSLEKVFEAILISLVQSLKDE